MIEANETTNGKKQGSWSRSLIIGCLGCGLISIIGIVILVIGGFTWLINSPNGGVLLPNNMEQYAIDNLETKQILDPNEEVLAYYDATINLTGDEVAILTNKRVIYLKGERTTDIYLEDIEDIQHHKDNIGMDIILVTSRSGKVMKIEIAPLNSGEVFYEVLQNAWNSAQD